MAAPELVGREKELAVIRTRLAAPEEGPTGVLLWGEAGIGKTALWEAGVDMAAEQMLTVLMHRSVPTEAGLAFGALSDLISPVFADVAEALAGPRRRALEVALWLAEPDPEHAPDPNALVLAFMDALTTLARDCPVVIALDDLQWLDTSSAALLAATLRRLRNNRVIVLATQRSRAPAAAGSEPRMTLPDGRLQRLAPGPLTLGAIHRLLRTRLGVELSRPDVVRILEASGGNPFFALELARPLVDAPDRRPGSGPIAVPESLQQVLGARLDRLDQGTQDVLLLAATLARPTPTLLAAAQGDDDDATVRIALEAAAREGVLELDGPYVRFAHPLLASLCYQAAPPWRRQDAHRAVASLVTDMGERTRHLALASDQPSEEVASALDAASIYAASRGATPAAAELAELAAARTPGQLGADRHRRQFTAAGFHRLAGDFGRAAELYTALADAVDGGAVRADALYALATLGRDDIPSRRRLAEEALGEAVADPVRAAQILGFLALCSWVSGDMPAALRHARAGVERAEHQPDPGVTAVALARVGLMETWALEITPGLLERAVLLERALPQPLMFMDSPAFMLAQRLYETDGIGRSRDLLEGMQAAAIERGDEHTRQWVVLQLLIVEWYAGRWSRAREHAAVARELAEQTGEAQYGGMLGRFVSMVEADLGLFQQAHRSAVEGLRLSSIVSDEVFAIGNQWALGHLALASGDLRAAAAQLRDLPDRVLATGHRSSIVSPWADTIETLCYLGELQLARRHLERFDEIAERSNRWARVGAARCAGLLAAAEGDRVTGLQQLQRALDVDDPPMYPFERARTLLALGAVRRQAAQRRAAREALAEARAAFELLGARPWVTKVDAELTRISGRRAATDELTPAERRVAALAAAGRSNKEIAAELFIGVGTVEAHLHRVYRKLAVRSRTELARRFDTDGSPSRHEAPPQPV